jgi:hypothetical protein
MKDHVPLLDSSIGVVIASTVFAALMSCAASVLVYSTAFLLYK